MARWVCLLALASRAVALRSLVAEHNASALLKAVDELQPSAMEKEVVLRGFPDLVAQMFRGPMCYDFNFFRDDLPVARCTMGPASSCPLTNMVDNTMVFPGGKTRCMDHKHPDFAFQVMPGSPWKLLIIFDGGGASWDQMSAALNTANKTRVIPMGEVGLLRNDPRNPLAEYTKVLVQYCSGDLHAGNKTQSYKDGNGNTVVQMGYHNTQAALDWALQNMAPKLENLAITGMSAGAIGAEVWSRKILKMFTYKSARVWSDSYIPIFPDKFQGNVFEGLGVCTTDLVKGWEDACLNKELVVEDIYVAAMHEFPNVGFGAITSTEDWGQTLYYQLTAMTQMKGIEALAFTRLMFHEKACALLMRYDKVPNFAAFLRTDILHVYSMCDSVFSYEEPILGEKVLLMSWLQNFLHKSQFESVANPILGPINGCHRTLGKKVAYAKDH